MMSNFSRTHEPFVILYLVLHFAEVQKCGIVCQVEFNVTLSLSHEKLSPLYEHLVLFLYHSLHFDNIKTFVSLHARMQL